MSNVIPVSKLLNIPIEQIGDINTRYSIELHDNSEIKDINPAELYLSLYFWGILKRFNTPITKRHILSNYYTERQYTKSTLNKILSVIKEDILKISMIPTYIDSNPIFIRQEIDRLHKDMLITTNNIYNNITFNNLQHMSTLHIKHFLEIQNDDRLVVIMDEVALHKTNFYIQKAYTVIKEIMFDKKYADNPLARGYRSKTLNRNQVHKLFGPGGFVTELDNKIFKTPIASSFTMGLKDMYEIAIESRNASRSLAVQSKAIADSEAFARLLQLITVVVENISMEDCGNTDYKERYIEPATDDYKGDFTNLIGKRIYDVKLKKEISIDKDDTYLIGTTVLMREVMDCRCSNKYHVCYKCFGDLTWSFPMHFNVGHLSATVLTQILTQSLLSLKHIITSATIRAILLPDKIKRVMRVKGNKFYINKTLFNRDGNVSLHMQQSEAVGFMILVNKINKRLDDIHNLRSKIENNIGDVKEHLKNIKILQDITEESLDVDKGKITWLTNIEIKLSRNNARGEHVLKVPFNIKKVTKNIGHLSIPFLIWVITNRKYTIDSEDSGNNYTIDLNGYPTNKHILELPEKEYDFTQLIDEVKTLVRSSEDDKGSYGPTTLLNMLFRTINEKVSTNIAILEIIVYALTVPVGTDDNYDLSRNAIGKKVVSLATLSKHRSFTLGGNDMRRIIFSQQPYNSEYKPHNKGDLLIMPNEVIKDITDGTRSDINS